MDSIFEMMRFITNRKTTVIAKKDKISMELEFQSRALSK